MKIIIIFTLLSIVNVIGSTARSIITIKATKGVAALVNAAYFAFYNIVMVYTVADFPLWEKCLVTFGCNLVGVYLVKWCEQKTTSVKLWKVEMAIQTEHSDELQIELEKNGVSCNHIVLGEWTIFNCYCSTCEQTDCCVNICKKLHGKISAYENKLI